MSSLSSLIGYGRLRCSDYYFPTSECSGWRYGECGDHACITIWAPKFDSKTKRLQIFIKPGGNDRLAFLACLSAPLCWCGTGWPAPTLSCCFSLVIRPSNKSEVYDGRDRAQSGDYWHRGVFISGMFTRWIAKPSPCRPIRSATTRNYKSGLTPPPQR